MADIILFRPKEIYSKTISYHRAPLGLLYIAAHLKAAGFSVKIIDTETSDNWLDELREVMKENVLLTGVGVMTGYQIKGAIEFSRAVKQISPSVPVVWGGLHPSFLPQQTIEHKLVDIVVIGEGERTLTELAKKIQNAQSPESVTKIVFKKHGGKNGEVVHTPPDDHSLDMDSLKLPDYSLVDVEYYANHRRKFMGERARCLDLNTDRGCPNRCGFCYNLKFNHRRWREMSAEKVLEGIEFLTNKYNLDAVNFTADNFFMDKKRVLKICTGLIDRGINIAWHADMRIDTFLRYEDGILDLMKRSGCAELTFGVESGSDRILGLIDKDIRVCDVLEAHSRVKKFGFRVNYHFMVGFPGETPADIRETVKLIYTLLTSYEHTCTFGPSIYIPYPGTPLFDRSVEMGFKPPDSLEGWIDYDWQQTPAFPWLNSRDKRYLKEVQTVSMMAKTPPSSFRGRFLRKYGLLRLLGISRGISLFDLDTSLARFFKYGWKS